MSEPKRARQIRTDLESIGDALEISFGRRAETEYDYVAEGSFVSADAPHLAKIAQEWSKTYSCPWPEDEAGKRTVWAPVHAWRALAQLRVSEALHELVPLLLLMDANDDDFLFEEFDEVLARLGSAAIPPMRELLGDRAAGEWARAAAVSVIRLVARFYPEERDRVVEYLTERLDNGYEQTPIINGMIVGGLIKLKAVESAEVIRRAFQRQVVDAAGYGDWDYVRNEMGLPTPPERRVDRPDPRHHARLKKKRERKARKKNRR